MQIYSNLLEPPKQLPERTQKENIFSLYSCSWIDIPILLISEYTEVSEVKMEVKEDNTQRYLKWLKINANSCFFGEFLCYNNDIL